MFASLKFIKPLWYFHLDCGENVIWPDANHVIPSELLDNNYEAIESTTSEASYVALMNGFIQNNSDKVCLSKDIVNFLHLLLLIYHRWNIFCLHQIQHLNQFQIQPLQRLY